MKLASLPAFNTNIGIPSSRNAAVSADNSFSPAQGESFQASDKHMGDFSEAGKVLGGMIFGGIGAGVGGVGGTWAGYAIGNSSGHPVIGMAVGGLVGLAVGAFGGAALGYHNT